MAEKRVSVRLVAEGGRQVRAELEGIGAAGERGFGRLSREMDAANARVAAFARRATLAAAAASAALAAAAAAMIRSSLSTVDAQAKLAASLGTTVASIQVLERAGDLAGVSMGQVEQATAQLTRRLSQASAGTGPAVDALRRLQLSAEDLQSLPLDERIAAIQSALGQFARHFGFDAIESEGRIRFLMRGRVASSTVTPDEMVASRSAQGEAMELTRAQETELPQALKWQVARADEDYDAAQVEARRVTVDSTRIASEAFPVAVPPEEAERRCRRALMEAWVGRETAVFRLPPSRLALDPGDVILLDHDGRGTEMRLVSIADNDARNIDAVRQDRSIYNLPPGAAQPVSLTTPAVFGRPEVLLLDLPQLREDQPAHRPFVAAYAKPWPGQMAVFRSGGDDGVELLTTISRRARIGALVSDFYAGPVSRFDLGNVLIIDLFHGTLESVTDLALFGGANALAIEAQPGGWEIVQAGRAELIAPGRYRLSRLFRGQRGTEDVMADVVPAGGRLVVLDTALTPLPIAEADLGLPTNWRVGSARRPLSDDSYAALAFTPDGAGLRPFSVAHVEQPWRHARSPGDLTIRWTRRSRSLAADRWGPGEVPLAEDGEAYEVEVLQAGAVRRVLRTTTTSVLYTTAQQSSDGGRLLGPGDSLELCIYQLSALVGRGAPRAVTLTF